jgi:hypothetical protein
LDNNYNFAIARVRLLGSFGASGEAKGVRVFFLLFIAQTSDTDYDINSTYPSTLDPAGQSRSPLVSTNNVTFPMFATGNAPTQTDYVDEGPNKTTITIPDNQNRKYHYFGCFLNVYDSNNKFNNQQALAHLVEIHSCIVA